MFLKFLKNVKRAKFALQKVEHSAIWAENLIKENEAQKSSQPNVEDSRQKTLASTSHKRNRFKEEEAGTDKKQRTENSFRGKPSALVNLIINKPLSEIVKLRIKNGYITELSSFKMCERCHGFSLITAETPAGLEFLENSKTALDNLWEG